MYFYQPFRAPSVFLGPVSPAQPARQQAGGPEHRLDVLL